MGPRSHFGSRSILEGIQPLASPTTRRVMLRVLGAILLTFVLSLVNSSCSSDDEGPCTSFSAMMDELLAQGDEDVLPVPEVKSTTSIPILLCNANFVNHRIVSYIGCCTVPPNHPSDRNMRTLSITCSSMIQYMSVFL